MLTPNQLSTTIGGSQIANILGVGYGTPLEEYNAIVHPETRRDLSTNPYVVAGIYLEPVISTMAKEVLGLPIRQCNVTKFHPQYPFMRANIDGKIEGVEEGIEFKNRGYFQGKKYGADGGDEVLDSELAQCLWYLLITGWKRWHLVVLIGGNDLRHFVIERDEDLIRQLEAKAIHFWNEHVLRQIPPDPINNSDLKALFPMDNGTSVVASSEIIELIDALRLAKLEKVSVEIQIKNQIGAHSTIVDRAGKTLATWKVQAVNRIDTTLLKSELPDVAKKYTKSSTSRVLRIKS
jgi:predicted phage-related endonuclease